MPRGRSSAWFPTRAALASMLALFVLGVVAPMAAAIDVGYTAPDFMLTDTDGQVWSLGSMGGHIVLLYFLGHNASVCTQAAREIETELQGRYSGGRLEILGIDCWNGTADQLRRFGDECGASYPLLMNGMDCASNYDLPYNSCVIVDARGIVRLVQAGPDAGAVNMGEMQRAIEDLLEESSSSSEATWGAIKALYGR